MTKKAAFLIPLAILLICGAITCYSRSTSTGEAQVQITFPSKFAYQDSAILSGDGFVVITLTRGPHLLRFRGPRGDVYAVVSNVTGGEIYTQLSESDFVAAKALKETNP